jgi:hypothetical protein
MSRPTDELISAHAAGVEQRDSVLSVDEAPHHGSGAPSSDARARSHPVPAPPLIFSRFN